MNSLASVTGRLGYAWDRFLGYLSDIAASEPLVIRPFPLRPGLRAGASPAARQLPRFGEIRHFVTAITGGGWVLCEVNHLSHGMEGQSKA